MTTGNGENEAVSLSDYLHQLAAANGQTLQLKPLLEVQADDPYFQKALDSWLTHFAPESGLGKRPRHHATVITDGGYTTRNALADEMRFTHHYIQAEMLAAKLQEAGLGLQVRTAYRTSEAAGDLQVVFQPADQDMALRVLRLLSERAGAAAPEAAGISHADVILQHLPADRCDHLLADERWMQPLNALPASELIAAAREAVAEAAKGRQRG
jgi:hypothetical protein